MEDHLVDDVQDTILKEVCEYNGDLLERGKVQVSIKKDTAPTHFLLLAEYHFV